MPNFTLSGLSFANQFEKSLKNLGRAVNKVGKKTMGDIKDELVKQVGVKKAWLSGRESITYYNENNEQFYGIIKGGKIPWEQLGLKIRERQASVRINPTEGRSYTRRQNVHEISFKVFNKTHIINKTLFNIGPKNKPKLFKQVAGGNVKFKNDSRQFAVADKFTLKDYAVKIGRDLDVQVWEEWLRLDNVGV